MDPQKYPGMIKKHFPRKLSSLSRQQNPATPFVSRTTFNGLSAPARNHPVSEPVFTQHPTKNISVSHELDSFVQKAGSGAGFGGQTFHETTVAVYGTVPLKNLSSVSDISVIRRNPIILSASDSSQGMMNPQNKTEQNGRSADQTNGQSFYADTAAALSLLEPPKGNKKQKSSPEHSTVITAPSSDELIRKYGNLIEGADPTGVSASLHLKKEDPALDYQLKELSSKLNKTSVQSEKNDKILEELRRKQEELEKSTLKNSDIRALTDEVLNKLKTQMRFERSRYRDR